jgi:hypothetical protein
MADTGVVEVVPAGGRESDVVLSPHLAELRAGDRDFLDEFVGGWVVCVSCRFRAKDSRRVVGHCLQSSKNVRARSSRNT